MNNDWLLTVIAGFLFVLIAELGILIVLLFQILQSIPTIASK